MDKLRSRRGETLVETLAAFLVVVLTSTFFLTAVIATGKINRSTGTSDDSLRAAQESVEKKENEIDGIITVTVGGKSTAYDVQFYGDSDTLQGYERG